MEKQSNIKVKRSEGKFVSSDSCNVFRMHHRTIDVKQKNNLDYPIFPFRFSEVTRSDGDWFQHRNYPHLSVEMVLEGEILYTEGKKHLIVSAGEVYLIVPHSNVRIVNNHPGHIRRKICILAGGYAPGLLAEVLGFDGDVLIQPRNSSVVEQAMREVGTAIQQKTSPHVCSLKIYDLLLLLREEKRNQCTALPQDMCDLELFLNTNFKEKITSRDLVEFMGVSAGTIRRRFAKYFHMSPVTYLNNLRLASAMTLLENSDCPIKEVGFRSGFSSALYFTEIFRRKFQCPPSVYRQQVKVMGKQKEPDEQQLSDADCTY